MRWRFPLDIPAPVPRPGEKPPTIGELLGGLAGIALVGLGAYEVQRNAKLAETLASLVEALGGTVPGRPSEPAPKARAKKTPKTRRTSAKKKPPPLTPEQEDAAAARLLGVGLDASVDEIRAAFRARVSERLAAGLGFGDTARDERERHETLTLTTAKNRLVERARRERGR